MQVGVAELLLPEVLTGIGVDGVEFAAVGQLIKNVADKDRRTAGSANGIPPSFSAGFEHGCFSARGSGDELFWQLDG